MKRKEIIYKCLESLCRKQLDLNGKVYGVSTMEIAEASNIQRSNTSLELNKLYKEGKIDRISGKPVLFKIKEEGITEIKDTVTKKDAFDFTIGAELSLKKSIQQAKAAVVYPPHGLHTLILGETGTGKSMFSETMYNYAKEISILKEDAPFITFNCADYANNPQLLMSQLFGVKKGAYTGADKDRAGLMEKAKDGILFLDEVHRLPPEGQEMLFYIMDKGMYRRLGEMDVTHNANILIICATTEASESVLLKTFMRRIPMVINLPPLRERTLEERLQLVKSFFKYESKCIKSDIVISANALRAFMLYDCANNIGQLKSDIKLCCAKAFLDKMLKNSGEIHIKSEDMPAHILSGLIKYKEYREEIDSLIKGDYIKYKFSEDHAHQENHTKVINFYEQLEEKSNLLKSKGINKEDIELIMSLDIDTYLKKYVINVNKESLEDLYKVVDKNLVALIKDFLDDAGKKLGRGFESKILYALSMHISSSLERLRDKKEIINHQLDYIKEQYAQEFEIAQGFKEVIEKTYNVIVPDDEVGFITMFLCLDSEKEQKEGRVGIVLAMHGECTATSMADVVNRLLEENHVVGYNMPLDQKPQEALKKITSIVKSHDQGKGVLLMVDMGSLVFFGDMIYESTGIPIKTIEMVSTPIAIEAARKAMLNTSIEELYESCLNISPFTGRVYKENLYFHNKLKKDVIVTACITGTGTAVKLKAILENKIKNIYDYADIIPMEILDRKNFEKNLQKLRQEKNVVAVVSAVDPKNDDLYYLSTSDIFDDGKIEEFKYILSMLQVINNMHDVIKENVSIEAVDYINSFKKFSFNILNNHVKISENVIIGVLLHIACVIENSLSLKKQPISQHNERILKYHSEEVAIISKSIKPIEEEFKIKLYEEEYANIAKIIYSL
ncbi:sigma 54-interacting transcriptional regulator [Clostridium polynesiense]|uniref:sigma 54-interacting transcriptional regulator n=1 Tax=Clostridium polynesiense TaxID=1325933 RepID=UPI0005913BF1|nr:sigma-54-dependent transcriptional regulator [Clostridium polynesiense]